MCWRWFCLCKPWQDRTKLIRPNQSHTTEKKDHRHDLPPSPWRGHLVFQVPTFHVLESFDQKSSPFSIFTTVFKFRSTTISICLFLCNCIPNQGLLSKRKYHTIQWDAGNGLFSNMARMTISIYINKFHRTQSVLLHKPSFTLYLSWIFSPSEFGKKSRGEGEREERKCPQLNI